MSDSLIWLHEDALRRNHPVFQASPADVEVLFVWDDAYLQQADYSLKRLVFLYETLSELQVPVVRGETELILAAHPCRKLFVAATPNPRINSVLKKLVHKQIVQVPEEPFAILKRESDFRRFFAYWSKAEGSAVLPNGGNYGKDG